MSFMGNCAFFFCLWPSQVMNLFFIKFMMDLSRVQWHDSFPNAVVDRNKSLIENLARYESLNEKLIEICPLPLQGLKSNRFIFNSHSYCDGLWILISCIAKICSFAIEQNNVLYLTHTISSP